MLKNLIRHLAMLDFLALGLSMVGQTPELRHVFDIHAEIGPALNVGDVKHGKRVIIPITGGEVRGEVEGKILSGGADYQLVDTVGMRSELRAVYTVMTCDSTLINVTNEGLNCFGGNEYYFMTAPKFECDRSSSYSWLNDRIFVCRPVSFEPNGIVLRVWEVK